MEPKEPMPPPERGSHGHSSLSPGQQYSPGHLSPPPWPGSMCHPPLAGLPHFFHLSHFSLRLFSGMTLTHKRQECLHCQQSILQGAHSIMEEPTVTGLTAHGQQPSCIATPPCLVFQDHLPNEPLAPKPGPQLAALGTLHEGTEPIHLWPPPPC